MKNARFLLFILFLGIGISSCDDEVWDTDHMRTGAILEISTKGNRSTNYEAIFFEGVVKNVSSEIATGKTVPENKVFRVKKGNDGKAQNLWLPVGTFTVVVINHDTKSFAYTLLDTRFDSYAVLKADFDNTEDCGCGKLYREKWDIPVTFTN